MRLFRFAFLVAALAAIVAPAPALAITGGAPGGDAHPEVGLLVAVVPGAGLQPVCSGTLVAPTVFLTAGHCTAPLAGAGVTRLYVTFDPQPDLLAAPLLAASSWTTDPQFGHDRADLHDLAVVLCAAPAPVAPAALPHAGADEGLAPRHSVGARLPERVRPAPVGCARQSIRPRRSAVATACVRVVAPSLSQALRRCVRTVSTPIDSALPISSCERPSPSRTSTSCSRAVSFAGSAPRPTARAASTGPMYVAPLSNARRARLG